MDNYKRVIPLDEQTTYLMGRVSFGGCSPLDKERLATQFLDFLTSYDRIDTYYFIFHDNVETYHLHFVVYCRAVTRPITLINKISAFMNVNTAVILCDKCVDVGAHLNYLLHRDNKSIQEGKKQYNPEEFISNNPVEVINSLIHSKKGNISYEYLVSLVLKYKYDCDVMRALTPALFHKYRNEIAVLREEISYVKLQYDQMKQEGENEELPF